MNHDQISLTRLATCHPKHRDQFLRFYSDLERETGQHWRVTHALRTFAEQAALYAQGRTAPGKIVTKAAAGQSWHNFALAIDVLPMSPDFKQIATVSDDVWKLAGRIGSRHGMIWGGTFKPRDAAGIGWDRGHFELHPNQVGLSTLQKWYKERRFIPGTEYVDLPPF